MNKKTKCYVFLMVFAVVFTCIGCAGTNNSENTETATGDYVESTAEDSVSSEKSNFGKFIYDEDFTLVGKVIPKKDGDFGTDLEGGILRIDIPDEADKYYQINVTTYDPESEVSACYYYTYNYEYKKDKFSDFISASGEGGGQRDYGLDGKAHSSGFGHADKMEDINTVVYVTSHWAHMSFKDTTNSVEPRITNSNLSIQLDIPFYYGPNQQKVGDTLTSHGHIRIEEIDKNEAGYNCFEI